MPWPKDDEHLALSRLFMKIYVLCPTPDQSNEFEEQVNLIGEYTATREEWDGFKANVTIATLQQGNSDAFRDDLDSVAKLWAKSCHYDGMP